MGGGNADDEDEEETGGTFASPPCFMHELDPAYLGLPARPRQPGERDREEEDEAAADPPGAGATGAPPEKTAE